MITTIIINDKSNKIPFLDLQSCALPPPPYFRSCFHLGRSKEKKREEEEKTEMDDDDRGGKERFVVRRPFAVKAASSFAVRLPKKIPD